MISQKASNVLIFRNIATSNIHFVVTVLKQVYQIIILKKQLT
jgi:hypothetical protein